MAAPRSAAPPDWRAATATGRASGHGPVRLRPLAVGELLDDAFELLRDRWRTLLILVGALVLPVEIVRGLLQRDVLAGLGVGELLTDPETTQLLLEQTAPATAEVTTVRIVAAVTVFALVEGLVARVGVSALLGERLGPVEAVRATVRRWPALLVGWFLVLTATFGTGALALLVVAAGGVLFAGLALILLLVAVPVGVVAYTLFRAVPAIIIVEGLGPLAAMRRSARLLRPRFFAVLGVVVLALLVGWLVETALATVPTAAGVAVGMESGWLLVSMGALVAGIVVRSFQALVAALLYVDARVRREGLDLEIRADTGVSP